MTDTDENLLTAAKLSEQIRGELEGPPFLEAPTGLVDDGDDARVMNFLEQSAATLLVEEDAGAFAGSELGRLLVNTFGNEAASRALREADYGTLSHIVGVTETDYRADSIEVVAYLLEAIGNDGAPAFATIAGNPNSGKTNTLFKLVAIADRVIEDLVVISNVRSWDRTDHVATGMYDLFRLVLEHRERPKAVVVDEASTHFDARTYRREVAQQWTPAAKRFAKVGVELAGVVCHTGKDVHPEQKRLTTLGVWKDDRETARFYERWPADSDRPADEAFPGPIGGFEPYFGSYDPDDSAPWAWDLPIGMFTVDRDWPGLHEALLEAGQDSG